MLQPVKIAAVAAIMFLAPAVPARAADTVTADDTARFLAGMAPSADSPLTPLTQDPAWQRHAKFFDAAFAQLDRHQLAKIRTWAAANLAAPRPTMFYMLSGPDFLYADAFYSKATTYVLSALEPVGSVPDLERLPRGGIGAALYNVERSLGSVLSFSFFITKQMKTHLHAGQLSGTFTTVRNFLRANSATVIQDDSGIPLAYYSPKRWRLFPFGRYAGPIAEFEGRYQEEYAELFRRSQPMDFGIGYRWRSHESNLLLAVKLPSDDSGRVASTSSTESPHLTSPKRQRRPRPPQSIFPRGFPLFWR